MTILLTISSSSSSFLLAYFGTGPYTDQLLKENTHSDRCLRVSMQIFVQYHPLLHLTLWHHLLDALTFCRLVSPLLSHPLGGHGPPCFRNTSLAFNLCGLNLSLFISLSAVLIWWHIVGSCTINIFFVSANTSIDTAKFVFFYIYI